jgi:hypothetical protein
MGYETAYTLSIGDVAVNDAIDHVVANQDAYPYSEDVLQEVIKGYCIYAKWYDHEDDMRNLSSAFPEERFILTGYGEDQPDAWAKHFVNGRMQVCTGEIVFPPFDANKLT